jgi:hypothetical protein
VANTWKKGEGRGRGEEEGNWPMHGGGRGKGVCCGLVNNRVKCVMKHVCVYTYTLCVYIVIYRNYDSYTTLLVTGGWGFVVEPAESHLFVSLQCTR